MKEQCWCAVRVGVLISLLIGLYSLAGCGSGGTEVGNPGTGGLSYGSADDRELENYIKGQLAASVVEGTWADGVPNSPPSTNDGTVGDGEARDYSDTNVQEAGVDESDKIKSDGTHLYVAQGAGVRVVRLDPGGTMSPVARVPASGPVDSLYLYESVMVAIYHPAGAEGTDWCGPGAPTIAVPGAMPCWIPAQAKTGVLLVDVQDPANPVRLSDRVFDGTLVSSRRIGGKLHLVSRFIPAIPPLDYYYFGGGREAVIQRNRDALKGLSLEDLLPAIESRDSQGNVIDRGRLVATGNFLRSSLPQGGSIVTVSTFDLERPQETAVQSIGAVLDARHVYASTAALYLGAERWINGQVKTFLHKFDLGGEKVAYAASGSVSGSVLNQFSLGEYEGVLRVATQTWSGGTQASHVYCLRQGDGGLPIVGRLENLAPGERLYAARFLGPRGFLVTFVQVDPLFTLDLADPAAPKIVGELKVPGYSDYLHPLGEDLLLSIGKEADSDSGLYQGVQLSIFDISDFANPTLLAREVIGDRGTESQALYDHKAFTWWGAYGLLAIPVDLYQHQTSLAAPWVFGQHTFSGLYVYRVDPEAARVDPQSGFTLLGRIATASSATTGGWYSTWTRGLFAADAVYAVTPGSVFSAELTDIEKTVTALAIDN